MKSDSEQTDPRAGAADPAPPHANLASLGPESHTQEWLARLGGANVAGLSPRELEAAYQRARQMLGAQLLEPAQAVLKALLLLQPDSVRVVRALGITYLRRSDAKRARALFRYGLRLDADDVVMRLLCGECMLLCGERETGVRLIEQTLGTAVSRPHIHAYIVRAQKCLMMARAGVA